MTKEEFFNREPIALESVKLKLVEGDKDGTCEGCWFNDYNVIECRAPAHFNCTELIIDGLKVNCIWSGCTH